MEAARYWLDRGIRMLGYSADAAFIVDGGAQVTAALRDHLKSRGG